jgi:NRPS condensation-like uncharacterized protein
MSDQGVDVGPVGKQHDPRRYPAEPQDLLNFLGRGVANQQLNLLLHLGGSLDEDRLRQALRLTFEAQPVLGCRFVEGPDRPYWERRTDLDEVDPCAVVPCEDAEAELWRFVAAPTDPCRAPLVRAAVLRDGTDTLCVKVDHVAADAAGARQYVALLAKTYAELGSGAGPSPAPAAQVERGLGQVLRQFAPQTLERIGAEFRGGGRPAFGWPAATSATTEVAFTMRRLTAERMRAVRAWGRLRGATLNDVLLAAFYRALIALFDPPGGEPLPVQVPVDLRRYLPGGAAAAVCNLSSAVWPAISWGSAASPESALAAVTAAMAPLKASGPGMGAALFVDRVFSQPFAKTAALASESMGSGDGRSHPYLSNLGAVAVGGGDDAGSQHFGDAEIIDAFVASPALYPPGFMVGVSTFAETLTLTVGHPADRATASLVASFLDLMEGALGEGV